MPKKYIPYSGAIVTRQEALEKSLYRYFTGKPCKHGHISQRRITNSDCLRCCGIKSNAAKTPAKKKALKRAWVLKNRAHIRAYDNANIHSEEKRDSNRKKWQRRQMRRRFRKANAEGTFTKADIDALLIKQSGLCNGCGCDISKKYEIDHDLPLKRGGTNWPDNLQLLCRSCNAKKHTMTMGEFNGDGSEFSQRFP